MMGYRTIKNLGVTQRDGEGMDWESDELLIIESFNHTIDRATHPDGFYVARGDFCVSLDRDGCPVAWRHAQYFPTAEAAEAYALKYLAAKSMSLEELEYLEVEGW